MHKAYIREVENGEGAVLFIHGFLGSPNHFTKFIPLVPENYAIHNVLLKGHGGSVQNFSRASMDIWKNQVDDIVQSLTKRYKNVFIAAHSMGTFFAMDAAVKYPDNIKALFLLGSPLKIGVKPSAVLNTLKSFFNLFPEADKVAMAYKNSHSIKLDKRIWLYAGWIPRYLELFAESKRGRETILKVDIPCFIFQSAKDELVSLSSTDFIPDKSNISTYILENSAHFIYSTEDFAYLNRVFCEFFGKFS